MKVKRVFAPKLKPYLVEDDTNKRDVYCLAENADIAKEMGAHLIPDSAYFIATVLVDCDEIREYLQYDYRGYLPMVRSSERLDTEHFTRYQTRQEKIENLLA